MTSTGSSGAALQVSALITAYSLLSILWFVVQQVQNIAHAHAGRTKAAIALESCIMAAVHTTVFQATAQHYRANDADLHAFLEQLMEAALICMCRSASHSSLLCT